MMGVSDREMWTRLKGYTGSMLEILEKDPLDYGSYQPVSYRGPYKLTLILTLTLFAL